nr:MAG TPA: hypothetical protein [Caudoviricetes sp.]
MHRRRRFRTFALFFALITRKSYAYSSIDPRNVAGYRRIRRRALNGGDNYV